MFKNLKEFEICYNTDYQHEFEHLEIYEDKNYIQ